jgi:hypothetical protein
LKGDNYKRIRQKFTAEDILYANKKLAGNVDNLKIDRFVLEIN